MSSTAITQVTLTIIGGVTIYVVGEIILKFFITPVNKLSLLIGKIFDSLAYYANIYGTTISPDVTEESKKERKEAQDILRRQATLLLARQSCIRWYWFGAFFKVLPKEQNLLKAHGYLIGLSNSCFRKDNSQQEYIDREVAEMPFLLLNKKKKEQSNKKRIFATFRKRLHLKQNTFT